MATRINTRRTRTTADDADGFTLTNAGDTFINRALIYTSGLRADGVSGTADGLSVTNENEIRIAGRDAVAIRIAGNRATVTNTGTLNVIYAEFSATGGVAEVDGDRATLRNAGTVISASGSLDGLRAVGDDALVVNTGRVRVTGFDSAGLRLIGDDGTLRNGADGRIIAFDGYGMRAQGRDNVLVNSGEIAIGSTNRDERPVGMAIEGTGTARNDGLIELTAIASAGMAGDSRTTLINAGRIISAIDSQYGMRFTLNTLADHATLENTGTISLGGKSSVAIITAVTDSTVTNSGSIAATSATSFGMYVSASDTDVVNTGSIAAGFTGVFMTGQYLSFTNSGSIGTTNATGFAVNMVGAPLRIDEEPGPSFLDNTGVIRAPGVAILGNEAEQTVRNAGRIIGAVDLGAGEDVFVAAAGGRLDGVLTLGDGDDLLVVGRSGQRLDVADFLAGDSEDRIDLSAFAEYDSFADVRQRAVQSGDDVVLRLADKTTIVLHDVQRGDLTAGDFLLAEPAGTMPVAHDLML